MGDAPYSLSNTAHRAALEFLLGRIDYERAPMPYDSGTLRLNRMRELLARLGNPQQGLAVVHVAGTKGKGSCAAMIAEIARAAGYRTGLFCSPHFEQIEERLVVDGSPATAAEFVALIEHIRPEVEAMDAAHKPDETGTGGATYFEILTAMGLLHFRRRNTDLAILEVGLGGRLDSTNVCEPLVTVITSISFDHMKQLGNTLASIAREKAGIIKPGVPLVSGVIEAEPSAVIERIASEQKSPLFCRERDFQVRYMPPQGDKQLVPGTISYRSRGGTLPTLDDVPMGMPGEHQGINAGVAIAAIEQLSKRGFRIDEQAIRRGLPVARLPGRVERIGTQPLVIVDAAHNVASIAALLDSLSNVDVAGERILVFGTTQDKQAREMLALLLPAFDRVVLTRYLHNPRAVPVDELAAIAAELGYSQCQSVGTPAAAWQVAQRASADDLICATGSFFLATEIRQLALK